MTQKEIVLATLQMGPVCGTDFLRKFIPRYAARICELRAEGYLIGTEPCKLHNHETRQTVYRLVGTDVGQLELSL